MANRSMDDWSRKYEEKKAAEREAAVDIISEISKEMGVWFDSDSLTLTMTPEQYQQGRKVTGIFSQIILKANASVQFTVLDSSSETEVKVKIEFF